MIPFFVIIVSDDDFANKVEMHKPALIRTLGEERPGWERAINEFRD